MNLNKTEKLLAAKKKLKEFQLQKRLQAQEALNKQQNIDAKDESVSQCQKSSQEVEVNKSCDQNNQNETKHIEDISQSEEHLNNVHNKETLSNHANVTNNLIDFSESTITSEITEKESPVPQNCIDHTGVYDSRNKDTVHSHSQTNLQSVENDGRYNLNMIPSDRSPTVQKEHSQEMGPEAANLVADATDHSEVTSYNRDVKDLNQFLSTCLEEQKQLVTDLHIQASRYHSRVIELESILATKDSEFEAKLIREVNPLKEQLQFHTQTTSILIAEKADLTTALEQSQKIVKQYSEELEEINRKLKHSQLRINELEKELSQTMSNSTDTQKNAYQIQQVYDELEKKYYELRKEKEDLELETSELKQKLNLKNTEFINLQQEFQEKAALLSLNELRLQQLTDTSQTLESQSQTVTTLEQQLVQLKETLKLVSNEKDEASKQYQNYVRQLDMQQANLRDELENGKKLINDLESREKSYIQRLSDMEQQLQREKEKTEFLVPVQDHDDKVNSLMKNIEELTIQQEKFHIALSEKDAEIEMLTKELQELRDTKDDTTNTDAAKLVQALEGEKLGASRAVSQNQQLKQQLTEMENAFVTLSNAKLDLTEQLQAERNIGRKLNAKLNIVETEVDNLKEKLREKETSLMELEKEKLQNAQIADQIQHYQAQSRQACTLQQELQNALILIENLKKENEKLAKQLETKTKEQTYLSEESENVNKNEPIMKSDQSSDNIAPTQSLPLPENNTTLADSEPIKKLEKRFTETMEKVAELTDEKQKLEHLVLQLQGETETIGEYITLYQKQRAILKERWKERQQTFRQLVEQRNQQQEQLHKLKMLVTELLKKHPETLLSSTENCIAACHTEVNAEIVASSNSEQESEKLPLIEDKTTSEILDLLTEIKDCKDVCTESNFHPCPWCSGKLITV
ncbi:golgin subfamily A member 2-like [Pseudomyrmex gracilis]|uniref:golgin subfamily A member 2-like n=1 Tax=Pseudomyrmex gracilis TaxID=219809 RepID=UPI000995B044|nr:golgin subfamily A member 2-like [Pseudomyrmex gracilis]